MGLSISSRESLGSESTSSSTAGASAASATSAGTSVGSAAGTSEGTTSAGSSVGRSPDTSSAAERTVPWSAAPPEATYVATVLAAASLLRVSVSASRLSIRSPLVSISGMPRIPSSVTSTPYSPNGVCTEPPTT